MGNEAERTIFIPRITYVTQENEYPLDMRRKQFPIKSAFAVTANKSQGERFSKIVMYLPNNFFFHGQLYVVMSIVGTKDNIKIIAPISNDTDIKGIFIDNCVYQDEAMI